MKHDAGLRLIQTIIEDEKWDVLDENNITYSDFYDESNQALTELKKYVRDYNSFPPIDVLETRIQSKVGLKDFKFPKKLPKEAAIDIFFEEKEERDLKQYIKDLRSIKVKQGNAAAYDFIEKHANSVRPKKKSKTTISFKETAEERLKKYNNLKWSTSSSIDSPWPSFNEIGGWGIDASHNVIAGISSVGKSWASVVSALYVAFEQDMKVLFVSKENGLGSIEDRLDSYYTKTPYGKRRKGNLEFRSYNNYVKGIKGLSHEQGDILIDAGENINYVSDIHKLVEKHKADFVIVDGAYLIQPTRSFSDQYQGLSGLVKEYQNASKSQKNTCWVTVVQLAPDAGKEQGGKETAFKTRGTKDWFIDCNSSLALTADIEDRMANRVKVHLGKQREIGENITKDHFFIASDRINMSFEEINVMDDYDQEIGKLV